VRPLIAMLVVAVLAAAQTPAPKSARIEGRVVTQSGDAVSKATVSLYSDGAPTLGTSTGNDGTFIIEDIPPGVYKRLEVQKGGLVTQRYGAKTVNGSGTPLTLTAGAHLQDIVIQMTQQGVIAGRITDQDGDPISRAFVYVQHYVYVQGRPQIRNAYGILNTDDRGEYRVANLPPGRYYVNAEVPQGGHRKTYYPNALDLPGAKPLDVAPGAELLGVDIRLPKGGTYSIRGKLQPPAAGISPDLLPVALLKKGSDGALTLSMFRSVESGEFQFFNLTDGTYVLQAMSANLANRDGGRFPSSYSARAEVQVAGANLDGVVLPLSTGIEVHGEIKWDRVVPQELKDAAHPTVALQTLTEVDLGPSSFKASPSVSRDAANRVMDSISAGMIPASATVIDNPDGSLRLGGLSPGSYFLAIDRLPESAYVKSVKLEDRDVTHSQIEVAAGSGTLKILLSNQAADVQGISKGGIVTLWPKSPDPGSITGGVRTFNTDQNGAFKFAGLAPGEYYVAAWDDLDSGLAQSDDFLRRFDGEASLITVSEGEHAKLDPKLIPPDRLAAILKDLP
jgi:hypothetical protein